MPAGAGVYLRRHHLVVDSDTIADLGRPAFGVLGELELPRFLGALFDGQAVGVHRFDDAGGLVRVGRGVSAGHEREYKQEHHGRAGVYALLVFS